MIEFKTYDKIRSVGEQEVLDIFGDPSDEIVIQEKIDGGNFRFYITQEGKLIIGSRTQQLTSDDGEDTNVGKMFTRCVQFVRDTLKDKDLSHFHGYIFYGENCVRHTINYDWDKIPPFLGFDIWDMKTERFLDYDTVRRIFEDLNLSMVPTVEICSAAIAQQILALPNDECVPISKYALPSAQDRQAEGVMFKNYKKQLFAKYVRNAFKEKNAELFGGNPKYNKIDDTNNTEFLFKYCTNPRIEKQVFKAIEAGKSLGMEIMPDVIKGTYQDIIEENWREILNSRWKLDLKECRKLIAPRCRAVLQQMIQNNALSVPDGNR